jgi:hypothetical protein
MNSITLEELRKLVEEIKEQVGKKSVLLETPEKKKEVVSEEDKSL